MAERSSNTPLPPVSKLRRSSDLLTVSPSCSSSNKLLSPRGDSSIENLFIVPSRMHQRPSQLEHHLISDLQQEPIPHNANSIKDPKSVIVNQLRQKFHYNDVETFEVDLKTSKGFSERPIMSPRVVLCGVSKTLSPSKTHNFFGAEVTVTPISPTKSTLAPSPSFSVEAKPAPQKQPKSLNQFVISHTIGQGVYGKVKLARNSDTGVLVAIKVMHKQHLKRIKRIRSKRTIELSNSLQTLLIEVAIMKKLRHPNIIELYEVLDDHATDKLYLVLEYAEKGPVLAMENADKVTESLPLDKCWKYFRDLISGLDYLHSHNIVHCDIKPANLLVSANDTLKICDFGVAQILDDNNEHLTISSGSPAFLAPEMTDRKSFLGRPVDIWAAGITLFCFIFGHLPFSGKTPLQLAEHIRNDPIKIDFPIDENLRDLLVRLLEKDPAKRITIQEIKEHCWVTKNGNKPMKDVCGEIHVTDQDVETAIHRVTSFNSLKTFNINSGGPKRTRVVSLSLSEGSSPSQQKLVHSVSRPIPLRRLSDELPMLTSSKSH